MDMEVVLAIWLEASIKAHDFVDAQFWKSQVDNMRRIYIPASETFVYESDAKVVGFCALHENCLAAIFVIPAFQGQGIGKALPSHAKAQRSIACRTHIFRSGGLFSGGNSRKTPERAIVNRSRLTLSVYKELVSARGPD
jgi:GNAT superfamily N-acetyltransferase